jgi:TonB-dependent SusC/RagA subfamily outer membrane receptor
MRKNLLKGFSPPRGKKRLLCLAVVALLSTNGKLYASAERGDHRVLRPAVDLQDITITGTVTDEKGGALPGVSILVKGTSQGTMADGNGHFKINVPDENAVLVFSMVGYASQERPVPASHVINVQLIPDGKSLNEIVVVGYGTQKKATLTGSISVVKGSDIVKSPQPNLSNSFAGRASGVIANNTSGEPGYDGSNIVIRGLQTTNSSSVLIVVDGVPGQIGGLERLDPNDIESVSVLKDGSAAVYGNRAANGVILITTKHGKAGKASVSYSFNQGFSSPTRLPKLADAPTYATIVNDISYYNNPSGGLIHIDDLALGESEVSGYAPAECTRMIVPQGTFKTAAVHFADVLGGYQRRTAIRIYDTRSAW